MLKNKKCQALLIAASAFIGINGNVYGSFSNNGIANLMGNLRTSHWNGINYRPVRAVSSYPMLPVPLFSSPYSYYSEPRVQGKETKEKESPKEKVSIRDTKKIAFYSTEEGTVVLYVINALGDLINCSIMMLNDEEVKESDDAFFRLTQDQFKIKNTVKSGDFHKCKYELDLIDKLLMLTINNNYEANIKEYGNFPLFLKKKTDFYQSIKTYITEHAIMEKETKDKILKSLDFIIKF